MHRRFQRGQNGRFLHVLARTNDAAHRPVSRLGFECEANAITLWRKPRCPRSTLLS